MSQSHASAPAGAAKSMLRVMGKARSYIRVRLTFEWTQVAGPLDDAPRPQTRRYSRTCGMAVTNTGGRARHRHLRGARPSDRTSSGTRSDHFSTTARGEPP